ncbi:hypothetical protein ACFPER_05545 [Agromyces aurantiacus]|uniref:DUF2993 domain-containing protein n=1 Tax=Agromyces aurantiacus TaxID=165814 RepID=A0ABV9R2A0_9MICO|nr:hypothetical protein [Agromyces aurantiacus]
MSGLEGRPAAFSGQQLDERRGEFVADDFIIDDVDAMKERLIQLAPRVVGCPSIQLVRIAQQFEVGIDVRERPVQILLHASKLRGQLVAVPGDLVELRLDPCGWNLAVRGEVNQVLLFDRELTQLSFELLPQELLRAGFVRDGRFKALPHGGDEFVAELNGPVVRFDSAFNPLHIGVRGVTDVVLDAAAKEVGVFATVAPGRSHDDHALDDVVFEPASSAPDRALEVVVVLDAPFAGLVSRIEQRLDLLE